MRRGAYKSFGPRRRFVSITDQYTKDQILKLRANPNNTDEFIQNQLGLTEEKFNHYLSQLSRDDRL